MNEKPIILNAEAVRGFVELRKTQYRSPVSRRMRVNSIHDLKFYIDGVVDSFGNYFRYPFGCVGDRLWVREPFRPETITYKADGDHTAPQYGIGGWLPPVYMPRWASRITMEIEGLWIEPLQSITEDDAVAEGYDLFSFPGYWNHKIKDKTLSWGHSPLIWVYQLRVI